MGPALSAAVARIRKMLDSLPPGDDRVGVSMKPSTIRLLLSALPASPEAVTAAEDDCRYAADNAVGNDANVHADVLRTVLAALAEARAVLRAVDECLRGHLIGINCHGPVLPDETVARLKAVLEGSE